MILIKLPLCIDMCKCVWNVKNFTYTRSQLYEIPDVTTFSFYDLQESQVAILWIDLMPLRDAITWIALATKSIDICLSSYQKVK